VVSSNKKAPNLYGLGLCDLGRIISLALMILFNSRRHLTINGSCSIIF
jgi:hypothetical protein